MQSNAILIAALIFALGILVTYFSGIRSLQSSRRLANFPQRQALAARGRRLIAFSGILLLGLLTLILVNIPAYFQRPATALSPTATIESLALTETEAGSTTGVTATRFAVEATASSTPSPAPPTETPTASPPPALPIVIEAMFQSQITPQPDARVSDLRFSTVMQNGQPVGAATIFLNPVRRFYAFFSYT